MTCPHCQSKFVAKNWRRTSLGYRIYGSIRIQFPGLLIPSNNASQQQIHINQPATED